MLSKGKFRCYKRNIREMIQSKVIHEAFKESTQCTDKEGSILIG